MASLKELSPANWLITSNDGTTVVATNQVTGTEYNGTLTGFNAMLAEAPTTIGVPGETNYLKIS